jgi:hypothetical protein
MSTSVAAPAEKAISAPSSNVQYAGFAAGIASVSDGGHGPDQLARTLIRWLDLITANFEGLD